MKALFDPNSGKPSFVRTAHLLYVALFCGAMACSGEISSKTDDPPPPSSTTGTGGSFVPPPGMAGPGAVDPGTKTLHRLNSTEYNNTVADILGTKLQPANSSWLGGEVHGFDNVASVLNLDEAQYQRYWDAAILVADDVFASAPLKAKIVTCATEAPTCVESIIRTTGRRLFRRPLTNEEVATFSKVYTAARGLGDDHDLGIKLVVQAFLSSVEFLYRIEADPTPNSPTKHPLNPYELASRLSYFLWSSAPDDMLLASAEDGSLTQDDKLRATVDRMLADAAKGPRFVENFSGQWLGARKLPNHAANVTAFPDWSTQTANALTQEMYLYFTDFLKNDRSWLEFMTADINFVDAASAKIYGMQPGAMTDMRRVEIKDDNRFGFAGLAGFLAMSSMAERTSPTLRGRWVLANLLCVEPPPPPANVPELGVGPFDPSKNVRLALEEHRKNPTCAACHAVFDPYGLALEQFDAIGKYRTTYSDGVTIDPTADLGGQRFTGLAGLADTVTKDPKFSECISDFMFVYSHGREIKETDRPYLNAIQEGWKKETPSIRRLIHSLVLAETFRSRHGATAK